ncbi:hypothetical protein Q5752_006098 [Cryptotrichosporon argae]
MTATNANGSTSYAADPSSSRLGSGPAGSRPSTSSSSFWATSGPPSPSAYPPPTAHGAAHPDAGPRDWTPSPTRAGAAHAHARTLPPLPAGPASPAPSSPASSSMRAARSAGSRQRADSPRRNGSVGSAPLAKSAWEILTTDENAAYTYVSPSITDILGYDPKEMIGKCCYQFFRPDQIGRLAQIHSDALINEKVACIIKMDLRHKSGEFVSCAVNYHTVYDRTLVCITRIEDLRQLYMQTSTAKEIVYIQADEDGEFRQGKLPASAGSSPETSAVVLSRPTDVEWPDRADDEPTPRTFFLLDRFTAAAKMIHVSNDKIVNGASRAEGHSFYSVVRPSHRSSVRECINQIKAWTPINRDARRTGGHKFITFDVLKIPDLPPAGQTEPLGTDETERSMPGQDFITVSAMVTASSDGVAVIIDHADRARWAPDAAAVDNTGADHRKMSRAAAADTEARPRSSTSSAHSEPREPGQSPSKRARSDSGRSRSSR